MRTKGSAFARAHRQTRAARLIAEDTLTDRDIAYRCGVNVATLERWKQIPEFMAEVAAFAADLAAAELVGGIADRQRRVTTLDRRHQLVEQVLEERAADPSMRKVPGGTTGVVVRTYKMIGMGKAAREVEEYAVDVATLRELRDIEKQAAQELGQWTEKRELTGKDGGPITVIEVTPPARKDSDGVPDA